MQAVGEIIAGLTSGTLAAMPKARKSLEAKWGKLDWRVGTQYIALSLVLLQCLHLTSVCDHLPPCT